MRVQSPEIIRKAANLTEYRISKMMGISQKNYADIITGRIKVPSSKPVIILIMIAVLYAGMTAMQAIELICKDFGIARANLIERYNENKKVRYKKPRAKV